jgi:hypothetical protein
MVLKDCENTTCKHTIFKAIQKISNKKPLP